VMTPEFGAASQLEKIDMLDFADFVAINKFDRRGASDALRDVRKQYQRNRELFNQAPERMPVFGTMASRFNDDGVTALYQAIAPRLAEFGLILEGGHLPIAGVRHSTQGRAIVPAERSRYLAEIADCVRGYHKDVQQQATIARERQSLRIARALFEKSGRPVSGFDAMITAKDGELSPHSRSLLARWPELQQAYAGDEYVVKIRDKELRTALTYESLSGTRIRKVSLPRFEDDGEILKFLLRENVPGDFPYTAGVFAFKREGEDPTRMFAGEGDAFRTNRRFKKVSEGMPAHRLSTAFDSVTLYGCDPDRRPDIYGKIGNAGVSIATLDDMKVLYSGFDLCAPSTSVSMTINGPAPMILAMFFNTALDQKLDRFRADNGRDPLEEEITKIRERVLSNVRGTVQADILKEDQGQNTCIFSTEFALKMMGDIQEFFAHNQVRNFYSVSISGYHIAEAGANPVSQLAFTLSNGFTYVESYLARGMHIDDFAPNLSFFFSNGMDPEYSVIGRVARRIWAVAMKHKYGASERSQKLKYHIQTSGRSLHAQEMDFNDIRTTLQALIALYDNCNSLHTNAFDEAITTPTEDSVRRAMAIQLIINREWGLSKNENPLQGAFIIDELTDLVEEAVLKEFEAIAARGGVLGAMETGYQRGKIQEESMYYEHRKHDGSYPIIGVNTFLNPHGAAIPEEIELARSSEEEKQSQLTRLAAFQGRNPAETARWLQKLKDTVIANGNVFVVLMDAVRHCSLGQISNALYEVGGQYRRNM
ncbi:MAG TPA: methylmalonyl-CoA mutase family protein, partial [Rhodocyclaceae bacterium]|nr:methylmalonyl-CoA mutase family protein [Rhodocyclaceae bacterium]